MVLEPCLVQIVAPTRGRINRTAGDAAAVTRLPVVLSSPQMLYFFSMVRLLAAVASEAWVSVCAVPQPPIAAA